MPPFMEISELSLVQERGHTLLNVLNQAVCRAWVDFHIGGFHVAIVKLAYSHCQEHKQCPRRAPRPRTVRDTAGKGRKHSAQAHVLVIHSGQRESSWHRARAQHPLLDHRRSVLVSKQYAYATLSLTRKRTDADLPVRFYSFGLRSLLGL